jgi:heat shock protein HslJ
MKRTHLTLLAIALFFSLTSEKCDKDGAPASTSTSTPAPKVPIIGTRWNLSSIAGEAIRLPEGTENPYLSIAEDNRLTGFGGCNKLMGSVKLDGDAISFPGVGSTKMYCKETQAVETSFMTALRATNSYKLDADKLTLLDKSKELATLVKQ